MNSEDMQQTTARIVRELLSDLPEERQVAVRDAIFRALDDQQMAASFSAPHEEGA